MYKHTLIGLILLSGSMPTLADSGLFIAAKGGLTNWSDHVHTISNNTITFDDSVRFALGAEIGYQFNSGFALSGELLGATVDADNESAGPERGTASEGSVMGLATYYFRRDRSFQPFIGAGVGFYSIDIEDSNTNASLSGLSAEARIGALLQFSDRLSGHIEYKYYNIDVDDEHNLEISTNGWFLGAGVTWHFNKKSTGQ